MIRTSQKLAEARHNKSVINQQLTHISVLIEQLNTLTRGNTPPGWNPVGSTLVGGSELKEYAESTYLTLRAEAFRMYRSNPYARSIINNIVNFTLGSGTQLIPDSDMTKGEIKLVSDFWNNYTRLTKWGRKEREIIRRTLREGESFLLFSDYEKRSATDNRFENFKDTPQGIFKITFLEPDWIKSNDINVTYGIETDRFDVEEILSYRLIPPGLAAADEITLLPEDVHHIKINADSNVKRGRTELEPVLKWLTHKEKNLEARALLNQIRTSVVAVRKLPNAQKALQSVIARLGDSNAREKLPKAGSTVTIDSESDYEFRNPQLGAIDAAADDRLLSLFIAAGTMMPEFIVTGDASNANRASLEKAIVVINQRIQDEQKYFGDEFIEIYSTVIAEAKRFGQLPESISSKAVFKFPRFDMGDFLEQVQGVQLLRQSGLISRTTFAGLFNLDYEKEVEQMKKETDSPLTREIDVEDLKASADARRKAQEVENNDDDVE